MIARHLLLHIGLHKTGSTAIQHGLYTQHERLRARGFCYPLPAGLEAHHALAFLAMRSGTQSYAGQRRRFAAAVAALRDQAGCDRLVISSEAFSEAVDWQVMSVLRELFETVTVVVYLRRQDLRNESTYNQNVKQDGETRPIGSIDSYLVDYGEFLDRIAFHFGQPSILVRVFEERRFAGGNIFLDFLTAIGVPGPHDLAPVTEQINPSLGWLSLETMLRLNRLRPAHRGQLVSWIGSEIARRHPGRDVPIAGRYLAARDRHALLQRCAASNAYVARTYLGLGSERLFDPPEPLPPLRGGGQPDIDLDGLAAELWAAWQAIAPNEGPDKGDPGLLIESMRRSAGGPAEPQADAFSDEFAVESAIQLLPRGQHFRLWMTPRYRHHFEGREFEALTQRLVARLARRAAVFVDVGAHYGFYSMLAGSVNPGIHIIACEPISETADLLARNLREGGLANARIERCAVSDRNGTATLYRARSSDNCSFCAHPNAPPIGVEAVRTLTLDALLAGLPGGPLLIKIDTDGHEAAILAGMAETLRRFPDIALIVALNPKMLRASGRRPADLLDQLDAMGLAVFLLDDRTMRPYRVASGTDLSSLMDLTGYANLYCRPKPAALSLAAFSHSASLAGAERSLLELLRELVDDHWCVPTVAFPRQGPLADAVARMGMGVVIADYGGWCTSDGRPLAQDDWVARDLEALLDAVIPVLRQVDPDVVWTQTLTVPWGAVAAIALRKPHVWSVCERGDPSHGLEFRISRNQVLSLIERWSDFVFCSSPSLLRHLFPDRPPDRADHLYRHAPMPAIAEADASAWRRRGATRLALLGTLSPGKGQQEAVRAVRRLLDRGHDVELVLAGASPHRAYRRALETLVKELALAGHVRHVGHLHDPYPTLAAADVVLSCARDEGFGRVIMEAMLLGRPLVYARSGALCDYMVDGETGLAYPPGDVDALAARIEELVADRLRRARLGRSARDRANDLFTPGGYGGKAYRKLIELKMQPWAEKLARSDFLELSWLELLGTRSILARRIEAEHRGRNAAEIDVTAREVAEARAGVTVDLRSANPSLAAQGSGPDLDALIREMEAERACARAREDLLQREIESARAKAHAAEEALQREIEAARAERDALVRANENAERACALLRQSGSVQQGSMPAPGSALRELPACREQIRELEQLVAEMRSSTSWRVTIPLRWIKIRLQAIRGTTR